MAIVEVKVPQLSESVAEATMLQWKKKVGDSVTADEILIDIETDKVVLEVPAPSSGVIVEILVADGGTVAAGDVSMPIDLAALPRPPPHVVLKQQSRAYIIWSETGDSPY